MPDLQAQRGFLFFWRRIEDLVSFKLQKWTPFDEFKLENWTPDFELSIEG